MTTSAKPAVRSKIPAYEDIRVGDKIAYRSMAATAPLAWGEVISIAEWETQHGLKHKGEMPIAAHFEGQAYGWIEYDSVAGYLPGRPRCMECNENIPPDNDYLCENCRA